ncbi:Elongator subunit elp4 [Tieghemiomyces parasiticus]|uniref:Elongator complex protein 4 n=1 Tax=Tieghemiomyces parasiticus TaxID=78921 RepID=A0A9W8AFJ0_9FUNG|nr:Elongator subunit elp4 [Tieghemiomyces parasiticus]
MSSFRKRGASQQPKLPPGTKLSAHNGQVLVSSGVPSLDDVLGGGLAVGSVVLVLADRRTSYAEVLLNYFVAQGLASGHRIHMASADSHPGELLSRLPSWCPEVSVSSAPATPGTVRVAAADSSTTAGANGSVPPVPEINTADKAVEPAQPEEKLKIAWRYQNLPTSQGRSGPRPPGTASGNRTITPSIPAGTATARPFCESFDLMRRVRPEVIADAKLSATYLDGPRDDSHQLGDRDPYERLFSEVARIVEGEGFSALTPTPPGTERNIFRLVIHSLASPFWEASSDEACLQFLHALRGLLRFSFGTCMITMPAHVYRSATAGGAGREESGWVRRLERMCDAVVELESFAGSRHATAQTPTANQYQGYFYIHKQPQLNSLVPSSSKLSIVAGSQLSGNSLAFRLRRHKFTVETFHLPPEGGVSERRVEPPKSVTRRAERPAARSEPRDTKSLDF